MSTDPAIVAIFGPAPAGMDLSENRSPNDNAIVIVCVSVAVVALALRLWARQVQKSGLETDDFMMFPALVSRPHGGV